MQIIQTGSECEFLQLQLGSFIPCEANLHPIGLVMRNLRIDNGRPLLEESQDWKDILSQPTNKSSVSGKKGEMKLSASCYYQCVLDIHV
uniref:Uncharacterized protein n=1 Tax=Glossina morsitans morsitans TaxID=37546 RepID=A0A1B0FH57_GLOMM